jgi:DNA-binding transcriptional regulator GbsR (MarR family)
MAQGATMSSDLRSPAMGARSASSGWVLAGDRPAGTVQFEEEMVSFFVDAAELLGVPKSVAAIYGIIFASPEPLSFSEISARLDLSSGSVSQGLKALREIGAIQEVSTDKDRLERFAPDLELRKLILRFLDQKVQKQLRSGQNRLDELTRLMPKGKNGGEKTLRVRLHYLEQWHRKARALLPVMKAFLKLTKI